jgi:methylated-DNA-protein-cysteine methyltransferase-like protein
MSRRTPSEVMRDLSPLDRAIYAAVRCIPCGKVATYGQIAKIIGKPRAARAVGRALRLLPEALSNRVPWQRVVNAAGRCSERGGFWAERQRDRLEAEGIAIGRSGKIDMRQAVWKGPSSAEATKLRRSVAATDPPKRAGARRSAWVATPTR